MLGRLHMSLEQCKKAYIELSERVFTPRHLITRLGSGSPFFGPRFQTRPLEDEIINIIATALTTTREEAMKVLLKEDENEKRVECKVQVIPRLHNWLQTQSFRFVVSQNNSIKGQPAILRSYRNDLSPLEQ
jgi:hypothetical protein